MESTLLERVRAHLRQKRAALREWFGANIEIEHDHHATPREEETG
jgi:hypothetical protein